jgi:FtsP/CotA-like multicopper oxidase with cupredoxin domain
VPNTLSKEFNWLTFNGKAGPAATPMLVKRGERVGIRIINIGMDRHRIHLHGMQFTVTGTESGRIPESARYQQNIVIVGSRRLATSNSWRSILATGCCTAICRTT